MDEQNDKFAIRCNSVRVAYGRQEVLHDVTLDIEHGCLLPLVGPNGAGKSTLLRAILGLVPLRGGKIKTPFKSKPPGYVPQIKSIDPIFPVTLRRIVEMGFYPKLGWWRTTSIAQKEMVDKTLNDFGLFEDQHKVFGELSGGMRQKTLLARVFISDADILLLDEPTSELDERMEDDVLKILHQMVDQSRRTVIFVHHGLHQAASLSPKLCWVEHGRAHIVKSADCGSVKN